MSDPKKYVCTAPEGGWGYVVAFSLSLIYSVSMVPLYAFGLVFSDFLSSIGEETFGTTLSNGVYNTVLSFTGLAANHLLGRYTCRTVGILGAALFFIGSLTVIYANNLTQFIISFGVLQGFGFGLMMPACFTAFNWYFDKKKNFMMALCQALIVSVTLAWPTITKNLLGLYDWRGTQIIFAALSLNCVVGVLTFKPPSRQKTSANRNDAVPCDDRESITLLTHQQKRASITSIGSIAVEKRDSTIVARDLNLGLLKDAKFVNIAFGLSLSYTSDFMFISMLPMIVMNKGHSYEDAASMMTVYFTFDLVCNLFLPVLNYFTNIRNRFLFLGGTILSAIFRILFVMDDSFIWLACNVGTLGFLRSFIQTPLPLVIAETYGEQFTAAFSLYMVVCGVVTLIYGPLIGLVKSLTDSDNIVLHTLTVAYILCALTWSIELIYEKFKRQKETTTDEVPKKQNLEQI